MEILTPIGYYELPYNFEQQFLQMSDLELLTLLVIQSKSMLDPVLVQVLINKKLLMPGEKISDIKNKIEKLRGINVSKKKRFFYYKFYNLLF